MSGTVCCICGGPGTQQSPLSTCIGSELFDAFKDGPCVQDPMLGVLVLREEARHGAHALRAQMIQRSCGRKFHQTCENRRQEASYDHKYFDTVKEANGDVQYKSRDLTHRLCSGCLCVVFGSQNDVVVKYSHNYSGLTYETKCWSLGLHAH